MVKPARFNVPHKNKKKKSRAFAWMVLIAALSVAFALLQDRIFPPAPVSTVRTPFGLCGEGRHVACVVDGDTVRIGQRRIRLTGFDAPEMDGACAAESAKARAARDELQGWLAQGPFQWTGGSAPPRDQYGRELREARRGHDLLAEHMVSAGLAEGSGWGARPQAWC